MNKTFILPTLLLPHIHLCRPQRLAAAAAAVAAVAAAVAAADDAAAVAAVAAAADAFKDLL